MYPAKMMNTGLQQELLVEAPPVANGQLRVLMVTPRYYPYMGGIETHVYEVARRMAASGVDVTVCSTDVSGELPLEEYHDGVRILRVPAYPAQRDYYFAPALWAIITRGDWDVVHCQGYHTLVGPLAMLAARHAKIPYVVSFHSGGHSSRLRNAVRGLQQTALRPLLARAARLVAVSQYEARAFRERLGLALDHFVVIPNGAQLPQVTTPAPAATGGPLIVSVGRLERYKGHHRAIAALPQVLARYPDARLRVIGAGPYEAALHQLVRKLGLNASVEIGAITPTDRQGMADTLQQANLVVLLSDYEAHPVAAMEAVALGRPLLVTQTSGLQELADHGLAQSIPLRSDSAVVAQAIIAQIEQPVLPADIELPTWEICADSLGALYRGVARRPAYAR